MKGVETFTCETFEPLVGETFRVRAGDESTDFVLVDVRDLGERMQLPEGHRKPFSLFFRPRSDVKWPQGTYTFGHDALEEFSAFCCAVLDPERPGLPAYEITVS